MENVSARRATPRSRVGRDTIRDQENAVLDIFSQESFFKVRQDTAFMCCSSPVLQSSKRVIARYLSAPAVCAYLAHVRVVLAVQVGGAVVVFLVLFFVFVIGPPEG